MMINFTRAFDLAWERMYVILFRPFEFGKWCAIGFSAFLAGFFGGDNGLAGSINRGINANFDSHDLSLQNRAPIPNFDLREFSTNISQALSGGYVVLIILVSLVIIAFLFAFILLLYWLGARGQFLFLDNLVRNRGAIAWPWKYYARQANSLVVFYLLFLAISFVIFLPMAVVTIVMCIPLVQHHRWPEDGEIAGFVVLGLLCLGFAIAMKTVLFAFREFGIPIMFRQGVLARPAFWQVMSLIRQNPGTVVLFVLLRMAIFVGVTLMSVIICCATCCMGLIPYLGTVILLPLLVYVRCFTLDCLAQFGPQYDVWIVDVPPINLPPPLG